MSSKKQPVVRKASKKIADSRRVRFGSGNAPRVVRARDAATQDSGSDPLRQWHRRRPASGSRRATHERNTPAEPGSHFLRGGTGLSRADARRSLGARDAAFPRLPVLRSAAGGFVLRLVRVSAHRLHPAMGRIADHLDLPRRESLVSAHQRPVPRATRRYSTARAPKHLRGFSPPFLTAVPEPGIVQVWTGLMVESAENWSVLVRPPANLPRSLAFDLYEGIVETDRWFGPLFTNLRLVKTDVPIHFSTETPLVQVQPLHRSTYAEEISNRFAVVRRPRARFPPKHGSATSRPSSSRIVDPARPVAATPRRSGAGAGAVARCTPEVNGYCAAAIAVLICGVLSRRYPRRRHRLIHAAGAGDAALRRRRAAFPALPAAAFPRHPAAAPGCRASRSPCFRALAWGR